jgi:Family of unknown function (DUF5719)
MRAARLLPIAVVLVVLGAVSGLAQALAGSGHPAAAARDTTPVARQAAVTSAVRACPPAQAGNGTVALIAAVPGAGPGQARLAPLPALPTADTQVRTGAAVTEETPGVPALVTLQAASSTGRKPASVPEGWSVSASGAMAQAMEAEVAQGSGLASVRCGEPGSDIWFAGLGPSNGAAQVNLDLMNIDALAASVDVNIITDAGPVQAGGDTGITVPPHQTVTESLSAAAAGSTVVAVEVRTSIGRVAADVSESSSGGTVSWLPSAAAPSTQQVIPGVPPSSRSAGLLLVVPGEANAKVNVLAITPQGQYRPFGSQAIDLPAQSASYVALSPLGGTAAALEVTANVPVTAAVLVPGSGVGAVTTATAPISEQAVVAGNVTGSGLAASLALSAPAAAARVRLTEIAPAGSGRGVTASQVVSVRASHTLVVPATAPRGAKGGSAFSVVITPLPGSGPLYAARVETQGQGTVTSIVPAVSALTTITLPPVRDSYDAISPAGT